MVDENGRAASGAGPEPNEERAVLGLFRNEAELRDYLASHITLVSPDLELLKVEYPLGNLDGAGGRIDILALDRFDHVVCIEVKRSDQSARAALNELSKYVAILYERDRVPREMIRCIVVSTHWSELTLPLSYFAVSSGVDVVGLKASAQNGALRLEQVELRPLQFLPQLCPTMTLMWFDEVSPRDRYIQLLTRRSAELPFMRLALLVLEPRRVLGPGRSAFAVVSCVWRAPDSRLNEIERVTGEPIGFDFPYAARGWEAELDAMYWIGDVFRVGRASGLPPPLAGATISRRARRRPRRPCLTGCWRSGGGRPASPGLPPMISCRLC